MHVCYSCRWELYHFNNVPIPHPILEGFFFIIHVYKDFKVYIKQNEQSKTETQNPNLVHNHWCGWFTKTPFLNTR